jgi:hypothetical protein
MQAYQRVVADLSAAFRFAPTAWRRAWWVLAPVGVAWALALSPGRGRTWTVIALAFSLLGSAELYRISTTAKAAAWAADVWRLALVWILTLALFAVLASLLFVVFLASAYAVASAGAGFDAADVRTWAPAVDARGRLVLAVVAGVGVGLLSWAMTRVALAPAATVAARRLRVLNTWPLTRRLGWSLLFSRLVIGGPVLALVYVVARQPRVDAAAAAPGAWMLGALAGLVIAGVWLPLNTGLMAYIYQQRASH